MFNLDLLRTSTSTMNSVLLRPGSWVLLDLLVVCILVGDYSGLVRYCSSTGPSNHGVQRDPAAGGPRREPIALFEFDNSFDNTRSYRTYRARRREGGGVQLAGW